RDPQITSPEPAAETRPRQPADTPVPADNASAEPAQLLAQPQPSRAAQRPGRCAHGETLAARRAVARLGSADDLAPQLDEDLRDADPDRAHREALTGERP